MIKERPKKKNQSYAKTINLDKKTNQNKYLLSHLDIELTERCNNNCRHCYINLPADDKKAKERELTTTQIKSILKEAESLGCLSVRFTGGEPLLREDFKELYVFARKLGLRALLFTNATLITSDLTKLFKDIPLLENIEVSLYGMRKSSYEKVTRIKGSYDLAWKGVELLLENKIPFTVKSALLPSNEGEVDEFENWAKNAVGIKNCLSWSMASCLRSRRDDHKKNDEIKKLRKKPHEGLKFASRNKGEYADSMKKFCSKFMGPCGDRLFSCGAGKGSVCVDAYGNVQACILLRHPKTVYNVKKGSLKEAIEDFFPNLRKKKAVNSEYIARCARCFLKGLCEQCPARSWMEYGELDQPVEYFCQVAHAQAEYLGLIKENERGWEVKDWEKRKEEFCTIKE